MEKQHAYLAVFVGDQAQEEVSNTKDRLWDQLRYDQCFPIDAPARLSDWLVFARPYRGGHRNEFNLERWESFGFRRIDGTLVTGHASPKEGLRIPYDMEERMLNFSNRTNASVPGAV